MQVIHHNQDAIFHALNALKILLGSLFIAICAQFSIPFFPVPLTGQTLAVLIVGMTLGMKNGFLATLCYVLEGAAGLPVFAKGAGSLAVLLGPTGAYILAFPLQAMLTGYIYEKSFTAVVRFCLIYALCVGQLFVGSLWLASFVGFSRAIVLGFTPFLLSEAAKVLFLSLFKRKKL